MVRWWFRWTRSRLRWLSAAGVVVGLIVLRVALEPEDVDAPRFDVPPEDAPQLRAIVASELLNVDALVAQLGSADVLLVGEEHFAREPLAFLGRVLDGLLARNPRPIILLLELPERVQEALDGYVQSGSETLFQTIWQGDDVLPYQEVVRWAHRNRPRLKRVHAIDENRGRILLMRVLLTDTRNETMAAAVLAARRDNPEALVVVYGGQLHMTQAGRYRFDSPDRVPTGARLLAAGLRRGQVRTVLVTGGDRLPLLALWPRPGAISMASRLGDLPYNAFIPTMVFGTEKSRELFDYFVNVGPLTPVESY